MQRPIGDFGSEATTTTDRGIAANGRDSLFGAGKREFAERSRGTKEDRTHEIRARTGDTAVERKWMERTPVNSDFEFTKTRL